jgi:hypothetical protein
LDLAAKKIASSWRLGWLAQDCLEGKRTSWPRSNCYNLYNLFNHSNTYITIITSLLRISKRNILTISIKK